MSQLPDRLVIASRGSKLALRQAHTVADLVTARHPDLHVEIREVSTKGDRDSRPFTEITGKGLFTSEVEREVAEGRADVAVHSAKDLTAELAPGCTIVGVPERVAPHDVVVGGGSGSGMDRLGSLSSGATVGTSSMRRRALLLELRSDLKVVEFRGNIDTRLEKVARGDVDAAILAAAGIDRLGRDDVDVGPLDPERWVPAPAQGALAVEALEERDDLRRLFGALDDAGARAQVEAERAFAARLEGGCSIPLGCLAFPGPAGLIVTGYLGHPDGFQSIRDRISGGMSEAASLGRELAEAILSSGGDELLEEVRALDAPEVAEP
ncbi:MAG TPA: hydroxymethylbilane synthase [Actinomycetota bacterium]|nr:hydroxymethylbilane synthase [Actinomycetota bacterium]